MKGRAAGAATCTTGVRLGPSMIRTGHTGSFRAPNSLALLPPRASPVAGREPTAFGVSTSPGPQQDRVPTLLDGVTLGCDRDDGAPDPGIHEAEGGLGSQAGRILGTMDSAGPTGHRVRRGQFQTESRRWSS